MKVAVISDMHGNCVAFDAVLADLGLRGTDRVVCLGDAIQGGPQPAETVQRLRELGCPVVMGNADAWMLTGVDIHGAENVSQQQLDVREWSLSQLSEADKEFIASFQPTVDIPLESSRRLLCFHGSPASFDEVILPETPEEEFQQMLGAHTGAIMCGGHTHLQQIRRIGDYFFFNPGSVGVAFNRNQPEEGFRLDPWAEYAVLTSEGERLSLEFRRVPFDVSRLVEVYRSGARPHADKYVAQYAPACAPASSCSRG